MTLWGVPAQCGNTKKSCVAMRRENRERWHDKLTEQPEAPPEAVPSVQAALQFSGPFEAYGRDAMPTLRTEDAEMRCRSGCFCLTPQ